MTVQPDDRWALVEKLFADAQTAGLGYLSTLVRVDGLSFRVRDSDSDDR